MPDAPTCSTCSHWSRWLPSTGDCMQYAHARRSALMGDEDMANWPVKSARMTQASDTCASWEPDA